MRLTTDKLRFLGRVLIECPQVTFEIADGLLDGLAELEGVDCDVARSRLALGLHGAGLRRGAAYVARSDDLR